MRKFVKRCIGGAVMATVLLAVSCKEESSGVQIDVSSAKGNLCAEVAEVTCYNFFKCCQGRQLEEMLGVEITTTEATCRNDIELLCERGMATRQYAMDEGHLTLLEDNINACLKSYLVGEEGCFPYVTEIWFQCDQPLFRGNQKAGNPCLEDFECVEDTYCGGDRVCRAYAGKNEPCSLVKCASAFYCGRDPESPETADVCLPLKGAGDECNSAGECRDELACIEGDEDRRVCTPRKVVGEPCDSDGICDSGYCLPGTCDDGTECSSDDHCAGTCSESGVTCTTDASCGGTCEATGAFCLEDDDCGVCENSGLSCSPSIGCSGKCVTSGYSCSEDLFCNQLVTGDTCETDNCVADTCLPDETCEGASTCKGRVCAKDYFTGDYCTESPLENFF